MININETLENLRVSYQLKKLDIEDCHPDPELQFDCWLENALNVHCEEPNAFVLSTINSQNRPRGRVLLLKGIHEGRFVFFTNYESAKGKELDAHPRAAMTFLWAPLQRQVRIEGVVSRVPPLASDEYFHKRPRGSQVGAIASPQSQKVKSRLVLEEAFQQIETKYENESILPRPEYWGGFGLLPDYFEFWQGRANRLHDRICYERSESGWALSRLAP